MKQAVLMEAGENPALCRNCISATLNTSNVVDKSENKQLVRN